MKKLRIDNHPNSYELTVTDETGHTDRYIYMSATDLAMGIIIHAADGYKDEVDIDTMRRAILKHEAHQHLFDVQLRNCNSQLKAVRKQRDEYRKERDAALKERHNSKNN